MEHTHEIKFLNIEGNIITNDAKKRTGGGGNNDGIKSPSSYFYQYNNLLLDYNELIKYDFSKNNNIFVGNFFPDDLDILFYDELFKEAGLKKIGQSIISTNIFLTKVYFKINNINVLLKYLQKRIDELKNYVNGKITKDNFLNKRIILWESFYINDFKLKKDIIYENFDKLRIHIETIDKIDKGIFQKIIDNLSLTSNINLTFIDTKDEDLISETIVDFTDIDNIDNVNNFISTLSQREDIGAIRLDHFMSSTENILNGGINQEININVEVPEDLPVVAIIDSGIAKNEITNKILINDGLDFTGNNNPFLDITGHGTAVGCIVAYGSLIDDYFISQKINNLIPSCKLLSVKVFDKNNSNLVDYDKLFKIGGEFGIKVEYYNIKIVNISFGAKPLIDGEYISRIATILDKFANYYGVIFVIASGNIDSKSYKILLDNYNNFEFYTDHENIARKRYSNILNITTPSELLSGISVGSLYDGRPAFHSRSYPNIKRAFTTKPDILSLGGGNYIIDKNHKITKLNSVFVCNPTASLMTKTIGTSFSTPRITRLLAIANKLYPEANVELLKALILHKISDFKAKDDFNVGGKKFGFNKSFLGGGIYNTDNEFDILKDSDDEITFTFQGKIDSKNVITFPLDIVKWINNNKIPDDNKIQLKLSICIMPYVSDNIESTKDNNIFHISAIAHIPGLKVIYDKIQKNGIFKNQIMSGDSEGVIIKWTSDYISNNIINLTYSEKFKNYTKGELKGIIGKNNTINVSIRGICSKNITRKFGVVLSIRDLGASGQIRNIIELENFI